MKWGWRFIFGWESVICTDCFTQGFHFNFMVIKIINCLFWLKKEEEYRNHKTFFLGFYKIQLLWQYWHTGNNWETTSEAQINIIQSKQKYSAALREHAENRHSASGRVCQTGLPTGSEFKLLLEKGSHVERQRGDRAGHVGAHVHARLRDGREQVSYASESKRGTHTGGSRGICRV